jgi:type II secretory pathway pseudopilin PulG
MDETRVSWVEIVLLMAIVAMLLVIALPGVLIGRRSVNESEAVGALRTLNTVETSYHDRHPATGYTCSLETLYSDGLIDAKIASGVRSGYRLSSQSCRSANPKSSVITEYEWYADPVNSETGTRHFCTDQRGVIHGSDAYSGHNCVVFGNEL